MSHLTEDQIGDLAKKVLENAAFSDDDVAMIEHIGDCEDCYQLLKSMMAVIVVTDNMGQYLAKPVPVRDKIRATISLMVKKTDVVLDQIIGSKQQWLFNLSAPPMGASAAAMSYSSQTGGRADTRRYHSYIRVPQKIEDLENDQTFVEYDPERKLLTIQVDCADGEVPRAFLRFADRTMTKVVFEKQAHLYTAQVSGLEEGDYELILEK